MEEGLYIQGTSFWYIYKYLEHTTLFWEFHNFCAHMYFLGSEWSFSLTPFLVSTKETPIAFLHHLKNSSNIQSLRSKVTHLIWYLNHFLQCTLKKIIKKYPELSVRCFCNKLMLKSDSKFKLTAVLALLNQLKSKEKAESKSDQYSPWTLIPKLLWRHQRMKNIIGFLISEQSND